MRWITGFLLFLTLAAVSAAQDTNFTTGPQYLINGQSTLFLHSIETPSLSFGPSSVVAPPVTTESVEASQVVETPPATPKGVNLTRIYWGASENAGKTGETEVNEIEISGAQPVRPLPASIADVGVTAIGNSQSLRKEGYGESLADSAAYWKAHKGEHVRTFTNKDVERSPGS